MQVLVNIEINNNATKSQLKGRTVPLVFQGVCEDLVTSSNAVKSATFQILPEKTDV